MKKIFYFSALFGLTLVISVPAFGMRKLVQVVPRQSKNVFPELVLNRYYSCKACRDCSCNKNSDEQEIFYDSRDGELKICHRVQSSKICQVTERDLSDEFIFSIPEKLFGLIERIDLSYSGVTLQGLGFLLRNCPKLESVCLSSCMCIPRKLRGLTNVDILRSILANYEESKRKKEELL